MSDLAITKTGIRKTASEFHDDFILYRIKYDVFKCPFCEIGLVGKGIYKEEPQAKSPHFACFSGKPHINSCDGYPLVDGKLTISSPERNKIKIGKKKFSFPEKLVLRNTSSVSEENQAKNQDEFNEDPVHTVRKRRNKAGKEVGEAKYTSSLVRSFAAPYKEIISCCYKYAEEKKLDEKQRSKLIKETLTKAPLELDGYLTNYNSAFKDTKFFSRYSKIWNGFGKVLIKNETFYIRSKQDCELRDNDSSKTFPFYISIQIPSSLDSGPAYHKDTIKRLNQAVESKQTVRWFVFGTPNIISEKALVLLNIENIDHVVIPF